MKEMSFFVPYLLVFQLPSLYAQISREVRAYFVVRETFSNMAWRAMSEIANYPGVSQEKKTHEGNDAFQSHFIVLLKA